MSNGCTAMDSFWTRTGKTLPLEQCPQSYFSGPDDPNYFVVIVKPYRIELMQMTKMIPQVWEAN